MTQKVLKSCQSKMATWAHAACDVHRASLYIETCWQSSFIMHMYNRVLPTEGMGSPPYQPKICSFPPPPTPHQFFILFPPKVNIPNPLPLNKIYNPIKTSFLAVVTLYTIFVLISYSFDTQVMLILILILILMFSIHRMLFLALKKVEIMKITPQVLTTR